MRRATILPGVALAVLAAGRSTVGSLFRDRARLHPDRPAVETAGPTLTYGALNERVNRVVDVLRGFGVARGDRVAVLSENRAEYLALELACAKLGTILACQNWRLAPPELKHCVGLVSPRLVVVSERHVELLARAEVGSIPTVRLGPELEERLGQARGHEPEIAAEPEDGLLILYTSGTTGLPKGAVISHRAEIARYLVYGADLGVRPGDTSLAWPPFFHMAGTEPALGALVTGGKVIVVDGFKPDEIAFHVGHEPFGHLVLMPGMIEPLIAELRKRSVRPVGVRLCGAMADLVPAHQIAEVTTLLGAPYLNSFGSTETGVPPASGNQIPVGEVPLRLSKRQNTFCEVRLVDAEDRDVPIGTPGELLFRGPTLFSGYWNAPETNAEDFRGGWFHMGDMFVRNADGSLDFVDRVKYMIKSGGENIYPAEIERVLLADPRVADAVVVRRPDAKWGEVPVAVVAPKDATLTSADLLARCHAALAGYKQPKDIVFVTLDELPRSTTGKIQRHQVEAWLRQRPAAPGGRSAASRQAGPLPLS
ncbi:MAG: AMP-binding protein [Candidatus Rokubacteria bacterium]|nr:AMP-binding protein [Candidatus Rokubacteria bacterium]